MEIKGLEKKFELARESKQNKLEFKEIAFFEGLEKYFKISSYYPESTM